MLYGLIGGEKKRAKPQLKAVCPLCRTALTAKCGAIKVWHWAHTVENYCDDWGEHETKWHKNWKNRFGIDQVEIVLQKEQTKHIADIVTKNGVVIEVQHSPISPHQITARENFYGRMIWVVDAHSFREQFKVRFQVFILKQLKEGVHLHWRNQKTIIETVEDEDGFEWLIFDCSQVQLEEKQKEDLTKVGFFFDRALKLWKAEYSDKRYYYLHYLQLGLFHTTFEWKWARPTWQFAKKPVFLDFHRNYLFYLIDGAGEKNGLGYFVSKERFLRKYKGLNKY